MKKLIPVLVAIVLIVVIGGVYAGTVFLDKYSYSKEMADQDEYFGVSGERSAIILQDGMVEEQALVRNGICYFDLDTVLKYMNEAFYADKAEGLLLYTTPTEVVRAALGGTAVQTEAGSSDLGYVPAFLENDQVFVAADFVKQYTNISYEVFERHVQVNTQWGTKQVAEIKKDTAVRVKGGVKSPVLKNLVKGEQVEVLEVMDSWSRIKTADSYIGYVENKLLTKEASVEETPVTDYAVPEYSSILMEGKVSLGWHAIGGVAGNDTLDTVAAESQGMNVIAPTWFSLNDNEGNFRSYATNDYVEKAHAKGLQVWGVLDDFNYNLETNAGIDVLGVLSSTAKRQKLVENITNTAISLGLDGINIDFEKIKEESGVHYIQFLRELSVLCRRNSLVLSVDNYVPFNFNDYYRLDIQGKIVDYVIIMGYDEHWHGSGDPGSVASIGYVSNGIAKTLEEVPAQKVVNALPLYTILWKTKGAEVTDEYLTIRNMADFLSRTGIQPVWDEAASQNYAEWTADDTFYQIWFEDEESIKVKLNAMSMQNIGGVAVWRLGYGTEGIWQLISAYVNS